MIEVHGVRKSFGSTTALAGVELTAETGRVLGLLGPNGAGKTTLVRILATLLRPDAGWARVGGFDTVKDAAALRSVIGLAGQYAAVDETLTGRENLELVGRLYHLSRAELRERAAAVLDRFSLTDAADRQVKTYSGGMRRRLDLGASLVGRPPVLILDEPTSGLDPRSRVELWQFIEDLVADGTTLLLTTQYLEEADRLAHRIVVIDTGRVVAEGTSDELKDQLGGDVLEARVSDPVRIDDAAAQLAALDGGTPQIDRDQQRVTIPAKVGARSLVDAARRLDDAGIELDDLALRRPSLDDVFLALTGHAATTGDAEAAPPDHSRRPRSRA
ncbi:MAG TPA: ATP-binding cassette domain-containing protein [Mycobacteriales bacterium]|nr:ATP-binding cassette domain-containing protein [Mycobacteriales bacterium]